MALNLHQREACILCDELIRLLFKVKQLYAFPLVFVQFLK